MGELALLTQTGTVWRIANQLHASDKRDVVVGDARPVHEAVTYIESHDERMHYAEARAAQVRRPPAPQ
ncbi:hypothetical protein BHS09_11220 [Myxococcus xanthus]|uniref:Uncharacterized protein n=1 Tax=Myxococcus xanthus TaxID=34 RepID=A0AAE6KRQ2_MYXXA|nr:hypothetical protein [Myxococcus xanthus]QDE67508.1 hypothetical protein BHS09_11220 [Myxococcus xanthus]QDE74784.1 hypothetical protein BHS08_11235 [Myxococcus xanthus]